MANGFLNDLPDLNMPVRRKKKKSHRTGATGPREQVIRYMRLRCPKCGCVQVPAYHTNPAVDGNIIRYHKCSNCGHTFKSIEENYQGKEDGK